MKKTLSLILTSLMAISIVGVVGCGGQTKPQTQPKPEPEVEQQIEHKHNYASTVINPTCTSQGYTLNRCSCGNEYKSDYVNAIEHEWNSDYACIHCGAINEEAKEANELLDGKFVFTCLKTAEKKCDKISHMIYQGWYFTIYESDSYLDERAVPAFAQRIGYDEQAVKKAIDQYATNLGYTPSGTVECATLRNATNTIGALKVLFENENLYKDMNSSLDAAEEILKRMSSDYASKTGLEDLKNYYFALKPYAEFCLSPSGSFSNLSSTLNSFRTNCENSRAKCEFIYS